MSKSLISIFPPQVFDRVKKETDFQILGKKNLKATVFFLMFKYFRSNHQETDFVTFRYNHQDTDFVSLKWEAGKVCFLSHTDTQIDTNNQKNQSLFNFFKFPNQIIFFLNSATTKSSLTFRSRKWHWMRTGLTASRAGGTRAFSVLCNLFLNCSVPTTTATKPEIATVI